MSEKTKQFSVKKQDLLNGNGLSQISGTVDVEAFLQGDMVRQQLQRDDVEDALQTVDGARDLNAGASRVGLHGLLVAFLAE